MTTLLPNKLQPGNTVRIITPARSLAMPWLNDAEMKKNAQQKFDELGINLTFGKNVYEIDEFDSSSIAARLEDLHEAFSDQSVHAILTGIGGFNSNQLLRYIDYELISKKPKILCGYSDITALSNALYAKTGLITYSGPQYFTFGDKAGLDYTLEFFKKCLFSDDPFEVVPSEKWSNDRWVGHQEERSFVENEGYWCINEGSAGGIIVGGNQCTFNLLQGTEFIPSMADCILFLEDDYEAHAATIDRDLQSLIHLPQFSKVKGLVFGRFQPESGVTRELITKIVKTKKELTHLPVLANVDFGHTTPLITFPIGGTAKLNVSTAKSSLQIIKH